MGFWASHRCSMRLRSLVSIIEEDIEEPSLPFYCNVIIIHKSLLFRNPRVIPRNLRNEESTTNHLTPLCCKSHCQRTGSSAISAESTVSSIPLSPKAIYFPQKHPPPRCLRGAKSVPPQVVPPSSRGPSRRATAARGRCDSQQKKEPALEASMRAEK